MPSDWLSSVVTHHGFGVAALAVFLGGLALNLTPCVYPMIPVTLAFFSQQAAGSFKRSLVLAGLYVVGISISYALLGLVAASSGALLGSWLQQPLVLIGIAVVIIALALSMFGLYELRLPQALTRRFTRAFTGFWGAFAMGLIVGLVAAPCIGPFVLGLALFITQLHNPVAGFTLFFILGLGMGVPYIVLGVLANRIGQLPKAGRWLVWSKKVLGVVLLGLALYFLRPLWPRAEATASVAWKPYSVAAFEQARAAQRPIVIDLYADWCLPCLELDHTTFRDPQVIQALGEVATLRIDATREVSADGQALTDHYQIFGVPTMLFFDRHGTEQPSLRVTGFVDANELLERLSKIQ